MPRRPRKGLGGLVVHVLNRSVGRRTIFHDDSDYSLVLATFLEAMTNHPIRLLAYCLMPNHWHFLLWPRTDEELSNVMEWFTGTHTRRWHLRAGTRGEGPIYQGRFKSFPVETERYYLHACRYIERNAKAAGIVRNAVDWRWSSLAQRAGLLRYNALPLAEWPVPRPPAWSQIVEQPFTQRELAEARESIQTGAPFGPADWQERIAKTLGLESTLRRPGRPRKKPK